MKQILLIFSLLFSYIGSNADNKKEERLWSKGNAAYQNKQYDSAIIFYDSLLKSNLSNAQVLFNLGNAYYKNNQVSQSVLCYERTLFLDPQFLSAKDNLLLAKNRIPNALKPLPPIFFIRWWEKLTASNTASTWAVLSLIIFLGFIGLLFYSVLKNNFRKIPFQALLFIPITNLFLLFLAFTASKHKNKSNLAVVISPDAKMQKELGSFEGRSMVPGAAAVKVERQEGGWVVVTLPDNREGWMKKSDLAFVQMISKNN
jgi:tetratricopeptide (TPR) repeat protein